MEDLLLPIQHCGCLYSSDYKTPHLALARRGVRENFICGDILSYLHPVLWGLTQSQYNTVWG